jgi:hypothetical protein
MGEVKEMVAGKDIQKPLTFTDANANSLIKREWLLRSEAIA